MFYTCCSIFCNQYIYSIMRISFYIVLDIICAVIWGVTRNSAHAIDGFASIIFNGYILFVPQRFPFHGFSVEESFEIGQELGSGGGHGEKGKKAGSDRGVFGRCPHVREEGRGAPCEVTIFSREGGAPRGVFSPPAHEGHRPAHGNRPTRTRDARASGVFRFFAFTSSPFACKMLSVSGLRVKVSPCLYSR